MVKNDSRKEAQKAQKEDMSKIMVNETLPAAARQPRGLISD
jgi:hypothetical protein